GRPTPWPVTWPAAPPSWNRAAPPPPTRPPHRPVSPATARTRRGTPRPRTAGAAWSRTRATCGSPSGGRRARSPAPPANGAPGGTREPADAHRTGPAAVTTALARRRASPRRALTAPPPVPRGAPHGAARHGPARSRASATGRRFGQAGRVRRRAASHSGAPPVLPVKGTPAGSAPGP